MNGCNITVNFVGHHCYELFVWVKCVFHISVSQENFEAELTGKKCAYLKKAAHHPERLKRPYQHTFNNFFPTKFRDDVCVRARVLSCVQLFGTLRTIACQPPLSIWFPSKNTGVGCHFLLQGIIPTQGLNPCLLHCRQILYHWAIWKARRDDESGLKKKS